MTKLFAVALLLVAVVLTMTTKAAAASSNVRIENAASFSAERLAAVGAVSDALTLPAGLCSRMGADFHTMFVDSAANATFFMSMSLCAEAAGTLTAAARTASSEASSRDCKPAAHLRLVRIAGTTTDSLNDDTRCGTENDFFPELTVLNATGTSSSSSSSSSVSEYYEVGLYHNSTQQSEQKTTPPLTLIVKCNSSAELANAETKTAAPFVISSVMLSDTKQIFVAATANCVAVPATKKTGGPVFYVALVLSLIFVVCFAAVLWRAKTAGDHLREIKRKRGERVWLG